LNTWSKWVLDPSGFSTMTREQKLDHLHKALLTALQANALDAADGVFAELRRLSQTT
jgi:hypothetical protein